MKPYTICVLSFGDHLELMQRCLTSIEQAISKDSRVVEEMRIGLNHVSARVDMYVKAWAARVGQEREFAVYIYETDKNQFKYPLMRRMLREPKGVMTPFVMWFDDDSYFENPLPKDWWGRLLVAMGDCDVLGQLWTMAVQGEQLKWVKSQPWFNPDVPATPPHRVRGKPAFEFAQGAWWVVRSAVLAAYNWPVPEIQHNGGDSMFGELCRHQGLRVRRFISGSNEKHDGVRINADAAGKHSHNKRRGHNQNRIGWDYAGKPLDTSHQVFDCRISKIEVTPPPLKIIDLFNEN